MVLYGFSVWCWMMHIKMRWRIWFRRYRT